jgi:tetratricopeptide (TPR) repeat protein
VKLRFSRSRPWFPAAMVVAATWLTPGLLARPSATAAAGDSSSVIEAAKQQFDQGQYGAAIATLESAASQDPAGAQTYYWMGRSFFEIRDYDRAIAAFQKALSLDSDSSVYHQWLGRAYGNKADKVHSFFVARDAKGQFEAAVKLNPSNVAARRDLADYCMHAPWVVGGSKDEALAQINAIAALDPVEGHLAHADYDMDVSKQPALAEIEYLQVLSAKPKRVEPYLEAAAFFGWQNKLEDMESAIDAAAQANGDDPRITFYRAVLSVLSKSDLDRAEQELKAYLAGTPDRSDWPSHAAARVWLGRLYEDEGNGLKAAEQYRAALQLDPQQQDARRRLERLEKAVQ